MIIKHCQGQFPNHDANNYERAVLLIKECNTVALYLLHIYKNTSWFTFYAVMAVNNIGKSYFSYITCHGMYLYYNSTDKKLAANFTLDHYFFNIANSCDLHLANPLKVLVLQKLKVILKISNITIQHVLCTDADFFLYIDIFHIIGCTTVFVTDCDFTDNYFVGTIFFFKSSNDALIQFANCKFLSNIISFRLISMITTSEGNRLSTQIISCLFQNNTRSDAIIVTTSTETIISNSVFHRNVNTSVLQVNPNINLEAGTLILQNVDFSGNNIRKQMHSNLIQVSNTKVVLMGNIKFYKNAVSHSIIYLHYYSIIILNVGKIEFSRNIALCIIDFSLYLQIVYIIENTTLLFYNNHICAIFTTSFVPFPLCIFQYFSNIPYDKEYLQDRNYSITFNENYYTEKCYRNVPLIDCQWFANTLFSNLLPADVNMNYIKFINKSGTYNMVPQTSNQKTLCFCKDSQHSDCDVNELGSLFPGQILHMFISDNTKKFSNSEVKITIESTVNQSYISPCTVDITDSTKYVQLKKNCTKVNFTIAFPTNSLCAIFLKIASDSNDYVNILYINQLKCPLGFAKIYGKCRCDPNLVPFGVIVCNINDHTILRPANSWISAAAVTNNKSRTLTYYFSLHCASYCQTFPSYINLSSSNSQCQFNRSGILCGQCQQGLSTIFSSFQCQRCSNVYMFLIIPIAAVAGLMLVLLLFLLNLTVTDGTINSFILYVNITAINASLLFQTSTPAYTLTSLANLDLGIQTCFYNGMDDYAKIWLQLLLPFYLMLIATLLIITSHYSTTIQRLTARRALPVLATLFLLSYTKILHTVSSVLFSYSTIIRLPSKHSTLVWSVDANVPLLGVKFVVLFLACLIMFLVQVPFTIILLFSRPLRRFHYINKFKPLLDAYQGPYKDSYYYWNGLHLMVRVVFLGISTLDENTKVLVGIVIVSFTCALTGIAHPFKRKFQNYHEIAVLLNLQILYIFAQQHELNITAINTVIAMAAAHFTLIVMYHIITYMCGGVIRNKIQQGVNAIVKQRRNQSAVQSFQLNNVPEVSFNYHEHREPLVALDS